MFETFPLRIWEKKMGKLRKAHEPDNRCSDCAFIDAEIISVGNGQYDLIVTALFNYERVSIPGGELVFGLKGGDLRLVTEDVDLEEFFVSSDFNWFIDKQTNIASKRKTSDSHSSDFEGGYSGVTPQAKMKHSGSRTTDEESALEQGANYQAWQVNALMGRNPGWRFSLKTGENYLEGNIMGEKFARVVAKSEKHKLLLRFTTEPRHVHVRITAGFLWKKNTRDVNKLKVANLYLWFAVIKPLITPYLSQVEFVGE